MDERKKEWGKEYGQDKFPKGIHITFNGKNFPDSFPEHVKEAFNQIRVPLEPDNPEFKGGFLRMLNGEVKYNPGTSEHTYRVRMDDLLLALEKADPKATEWFREAFPLSELFIFKNSEVESIID